LHRLWSNVQSEQIGIKTASFNYPKHRGNCSTASRKSGKDSARQYTRVGIKPLKPLATKIVNGLAATEAAAQTVDNVKTTNNKIRGMRAKAVEKPDAKALAAGAELVKTASTSQQSYDKLINHFAQLMATLTAEFEQIWTYLTRKCGRPKQHTCQSPHNPTRKTKLCQECRTPAPILDRLVRVNRKILQGCPAREYNMYRVTHRQRTND